MASVFSHPAVPLAIAAALGRKHVPPALTATACAASVFPDIDALGYAAGIPYSHMLGHRGLTHSLFFALMIGGLATLLAGRLGASPVMTFTVVFLATASHGFLDAMTDGGLGVAFFSPFSNERHFLPWRPIPVSPIGASRFLSGRGLRIIEAELVWVWFPCGALATLGAALRAFLK